MAEGQFTVTYRPIPGFPGYFAGDDGTILSVVSGKKRLLQAAFRGQSKYLGVQLCRGDERHSRYVHRLVLEAFIGPCPEGMEGCHSPDPDRTNNRLSNLRWDTHSANAQDTITHGTMTRGGKNGQAKITEDDVREIRRLIAGGMSAGDICDGFGITRAQVQRIARRENWAHVTEGVS